MSPNLQMTSTGTPLPLGLPAGQAEGTKVAEVVHQFCSYYSLLLLVTGCACNPLAFIVFSRRSYRQNTIALYLRVISLSDLAAILNGVLIYFLLPVFGIDFRNSRISCHVYVVLALLFVFCSHWTLVIVAIERAISITQPHLVRSLCTPSFSKFSLGLLFVIGSAVAVPYSLICWGPVLAVDDQTNETVVVTSCSMMFFSEEINLAVMIVDMTVFAFLPCLLILISSIIIVNGAVKSKKRVLKADRKVDISIPDSKNGRLDKRSISTSTSTNTRVTDRSNLEDNRKKKETSLVRTLLCVNTAFIVCVLPGYTWSLGPHIQSAGGLGDLGNAVTEILAVFLYTNNALNFFFYCTTGSKFRAELRAVFRDLCSRRLLQRE